MARHSFGGRSGGQDKTLIVVVLLLFICVAIIGVIYLASSGSKTNSVNAPTPTARVEPTREMVKVLVPLKEIPVGTQLQPSMFEQQSRLAMSVDERTVRDFEAIMNMYSRAVLIAGSPLLEDHITSQKPSNLVSPEIPPGYRAVAIKVNATSSVEGWAKPGSKVDVYWTSTQNNRCTLKTIVQNVMVLSAERQVSSNTTPGAPVPSTITLLVSQSDAEKVLLAENSHGILSMSLRGDADPGKADGGGSDISITDVIGGGSNTSQQAPSTIGTVIVDGVVFVVGADGRLSPAE